MYAWLGAALESNATRGDSDRPADESDTHLPLLMIELQRIAVVA
jgi:hypothetical protein